MKRKRNVFDQKQENFVKDILTQIKNNAHRKILDSNNPDKTITIIDFD
jgi:hypothetical protein